MTQHRWEVKFYEKPNGRCPTEDFLDSLSDDEVARIVRQIGRLEEYGPRLPGPYAEHLRDKIHELRARCRKVRLRILYFRDGDTFLLCNGIRKKSGRVPDSEIDKAIAFREDHFARKKENLK
jgi:hypothetical protein